MRPKFWSTFLEQSQQPPAPALKVHTDQQKEGGEEEEVVVEKLQQIYKRSAYSNQTCVIGSQWFCYHTMNTGNRFLERYTRQAKGEYSQIQESGWKRKTAKDCRG